MIIQAITRALLIPLVWLALALPSAADPATRDDEVEATSLLGRELRRPELPERVLERHVNALPTLLKRAADHPNDADAAIWIGLFAAGPDAGETAAELLARHEPGSVGAVTLSYGVGAWHLLWGRREEATKLFQRVTGGDGWAGFGFIAAEAELARR